VQAGVPLLLQNENPAGGLVVAAFSIAGAVLENDRDNFRFLNPEEIEWKSSEVWELIKMIQFNSNYYNIFENNCNS